jgi:hypothetical protein
MSAPAAATEGREVSIPDLLDTAAPRIAGLSSRSYMGLHQLCRSVAAEGLGLDLDTDEGHRVASMVADTMCWHVAEHLVDHGQHPHPDVRRTLADWMLGTGRTVIRGELADAAAWWRSLQRWERLP